VPQHEHNPTIPAGDIVKVTKRLDAQWHEGELRGKTGIFPTEFVAILDALNSRISVATACESFVAADDSELSLVVGDRVVVTKRIDAGWFEGRRSNKTGIFPANHVVVGEPDGVRALLLAPLACGRTLTRAPSALTPLLVSVGLSVFPSVCLSFRLRLCLCVSRARARARSRSLPPRV